MSNATFSSIMGKFMVYFCFIYMLTMTGLYFHLDARIKVLQTIQEKSLDLFQSYSEKDIAQQRNIEDLKLQINDLKSELRTLNNTMDNKLTTMSAILLNFASDGNKDSRDGS